MPVCGPMCSICCAITSVWGMIQLAFMGIFYYYRSLALLEDLKIEENFETDEAFYKYADDGYSRNAINCWIAACLYLVTLIFSICQLYMNKRA